MRLEFLWVHFPFQTKRVLRFTWISIVLLSFCAIGWAGDDVQQLDVIDSTL